MSGPHEAGQLVRFWRVYCGRCKDAADEGSGYPTDGAGWIRHLGWKQSKAHGWVCPFCVDDMRIDARIKRER